MDQPTATIDDLRLYFTNDDWSLMSDYEINCHLNRLQNYHALLNLGLPASKPEFMERNESVVKRKNKMAKTNKPNKKLKTEKIETKVRNEEDKENLNVQMIAKRGNGITRRNVTTKIKFRPPLLSVNKKMEKKTKEETSSAGMTVREKFKEVVKNKVETQVRSEKPTEEKPNVEGKLIFSETEKRTAIRIHNILKTSLKLCKMYKRKGINVLKELKIAYIRKLSHNKANGYKNLEREKTEKSNEKKCMKTGRKNIVTKKGGSKNKFKKDSNKKKENKNTESIKKVLKTVESKDVSSRYPKRNVPLRNYAEEEILDDDEYVFCDDCDKEWPGDCPEHGPLIPLADKKVVKDEKDIERAIKTTPPQLEVSESEILGGGKGVWTKCVIPPRVLFGPYDGNKSSTPDELGYSWRIMRNKRLSHYVSGECPGTSNWMRYVNSARYEKELNVFAFQYKGEMYYRTFKHIPPKCELKVWYGKEYNIKLGITPESFKNPNLELIKNVLFPCGQCALSFTSPLYLKSHRNHCSGRRQPCTTSGEKPYCCDICSYKCTQSGNLKKHMVTHTGEKLYSCDICSYKCTRSGSLKRHTVTHTGEKPYSCDICSYKCTQSGNLKRHMVTHTGEKPYSCDICSYKCTQSGNLKSHMVTHTGEKPYSCDICSYKCTTSSDLKTHMLTHTGEKPYSCDICSYKCTTSGSLKRHILTHTGEKLYSCDICSYKCTRSGSLKRHMLYHTHKRETVQL